MSINDLVAELQSTETTEDGTEALRSKSVGFTTA